MISVDEPTGLAKTADAHEVPFPLLSDPEREVHKAFNVTHQVDDARIAALKAKGMDLEQWSGAKHHELAIPSIFLIGKDKKIKWAHAARDYKTRPKTEDLLAALEKVQKP